MDVPRFVSILASVLVLVVSLLSGFLFWLLVRSIGSTSVSEPVIALIFGLLAGLCYIGSMACGVMWFVKLKEINYVWLAANLALLPAGFMMLMMASLAA